MLLVPLHPGHPGSIVTGLFTPCRCANWHFRTQINQSSSAKTDHSVNTTTHSHTHTHTQWITTLGVIIRCLIWDKRDTLVLLWFRSVWVTVKMFVSWKFLFKFSLGRFVISKFYRVWNGEVANLVFNQASKERCEKPHHILSNQTWLQLHVG